MADIKLIDKLLQMGAAGYSVAFSAYADQIGHMSIAGTFRDGDVVFKRDAAIQLLGNAHVSMDVQAVLLLTEIEEDIKRQRRIKQMGAGADKVTFYEDKNEYPNTGKSDFEKMEDRARERSEGKTTPNQTGDFSTDFDKKEFE